MRTAARSIAVLIGAAVYLGLSVLAWGSLSAFLSHPARIAFVAELFVLSVAGIFAGGNLSSGVREDRGNRWVLVPFTVIGLLAAFLPAYTDRLNLWTIDGDVARWIGVVLFGVGGALRLWPVFVLGPRFSGLVAIQQDHKLVTTGVYGTIRHPSYLGLLVNFLGLALVFRAAAGVLLVVLILPPLIARINAEEKLLLSEFGDEYRAYRARTSRLIPGVY